jgi:hypothetical protein
LVRVYCRIERLAYAAAYQQSKKRERERRMNFVRTHGWATAMPSEFWPLTPQGNTLEKWHPPIKWLSRAQQKQPPAVEYLPAILETEDRQGAAIAQKTTQLTAVRLPAVRLPPPPPVFAEPPTLNTWKADPSVVRSSYDNSVRAKWWDKAAFWDAAVADHSKVYWEDRADTSVTGPAPSSSSGGDRDSSAAAHPTMWQWDEMRGQMCKWDWWRYPDASKTDAHAHMSYADKWLSETATGQPYDWNATPSATGDGDWYSQWDSTQPAEPMDWGWGGWTPTSGDWESAAQEVRWEVAGWIDYKRAWDTTLYKMRDVARTRSETPSL